MHKYDEISFLISTNRHLVVYDPDIEFLLIYLLIQVELCDTPKSNNC